LQFPRNQATIFLPLMRQTMDKRSRKPPREKDLTRRLLDGDEDADSLESSQKFSRRSKNAQQNKMEKTAHLRSSNEQQTADREALPIGPVVQVFSLFCEVDYPTGPRICSTRKTLGKLQETSIVVGDLVRFRDAQMRDDSGRMDAVIEQILPRQTVLTRGDSFRASIEHPIVANAQQMLIVVSLVRPRVKWGLVDRMLVAAKSGGLSPIICLSKIDLVDGPAEEAEAILAHYQSMGIATFRVIAIDPQNPGVLGVKETLKGKTTVLAGHSGVGKSTLISAIEPGLDIRIGAVSNFNEKGRHTTTSARRYPLSIGGYVIDTPGVKMFGLHGVTSDTLAEFFPDVEQGTAPPWRMESFERIRDSLAL
jgi:ribosome biogenesis GTPase